MPMIPIAPPTQVAIHSGFDGLTGDAERRRVDVIAHDAARLR